MAALLMSSKNEKRQLEQSYLCKKLFA